MTQTIQAAPAAAPPGHERPRAASEAKGQVPPDADKAHVVIDVRAVRPSGPTVPDSSYYLG